MTTINKSVDNSSDQLYQCKMWCELSGYFAVVKYDLRSQVVYSKQPKLGLTQEFVVLLVRMRLVVCMFVCLFVCLL